MPIERRDPVTGKPTYTAGAFAIVRDDAGRLLWIDWKREAADAVLVFECRITGGSATPSDETSDVRFFDVADPPDAPTKTVERVRGVIASPDRVLLRSTS
jgi:hypothetical protein